MNQRERLRVGRRTHRVNEGIGDLQQGAVGPILNLGGEGDLPGRGACHLKGEADGEAAHGVRERGPASIGRRRELLQRGLVEADGLGLPLLVDHRQGEKRLPFPKGRHDLSRGQVLDAAQRARLAAEPDTAGGVADSDALAYRGLTQGKAGDALHAEVIQEEVVRGALLGDPDAVRAIGARPEVADHLHPVRVERAPDLLKGGAAHADPDLASGKGA